jgi:coenzyme F420 hydrogenase subunit beta
MKKNNIEHIVKKKLCMGCGACSVVNFNNCITLKTDKDFNYPEVNNCTNCNLCLKVCPGLNINNKQSEKKNCYIGKFKNIYIAHSLNEKIRFNASSGGVITQILLSVIEQKIADGIIFIRKSYNDPLENESVIVTSSAEILRGTGSRYSPASPCLKIKDIIHDKTNKKYVFVGKGCDIEGLDLLKKIHSILNQKIVLTIGIFCDHTPSRQAVNSLLTKLEINPKKVKEIDFRGMGWPGYTTIKDDDFNEIKLPYQESWKTLKKTNFSNFRCSLCPDGLAETADISIGDPWVKKENFDSLGDSLVIPRTIAGNNIFKKLLREKRIYAVDASIDEVIKSQKSIISKKSKLWMRINILKLFRLSCPSYSNWNLYECFRKSTPRNKIDSILDKNFLYLVLRRIFRLKNNN